MSNDRLWLVHRPSGKRILLAKKGAELWSPFTPLSEGKYEPMEVSLGNFFQNLYDSGHYGGFGDPRQDDFELERESDVAAHLLYDT